MIEVNEEEDLHIVEFGGKDNKPAVAVAVEKLDRRCEEPELGRPNSICRDSGGLKTNLLID